MCYIGLNCQIIISFTKFRDNYACVFVMLSLPNRTYCYLKKTSLLCLCDKKEKKIDIVSK